MREGRGGRRRPRDLRWGSEGGRGAVIGWGIRAAGIFARSGYHAVSAGAIAGAGAAIRAGLVGVGVGFRWGRGWARVVWRWAARARAGAARYLWCGGAMEGMWFSPP